MMQRHTIEPGTHEDKHQPSSKSYGGVMTSGHSQGLSFHSLYRIMIFTILTTLVLCTAPALADETMPGLRAAIKSGCEYDYPPFCIVEKDGVANGFSVDVLRAALQKMGHDVTFRVGSWTEVKGLLERGEIEALPLVGRTPEREQIFDFTFPYLSLHGVIVVPKGTNDIHDLNDLKGRQVAVMAGDNAEEFLRRTDLDIDIQTTSTFDDALRELADGRYDAVVIQRLLALRLLQHLGITNLKMIDEPLEGFRQDFCFAVQEGDKKTLSHLNEGLALVMADGTFSRLQAKWFAALELPIHDHIVVGGDHNYPPYEFIDENGRPAGYNVELTRAIAEVTGLDIEIQLGPWSDIKQQMANGDIDAIHGMFYSLDREKEFDFSPPHTVIQHIAVARKDEAAPPINLAGLKGKHVVVMQSDIMHDWLLEQGPDVQITTVANQAEALRELAAGKYDCALLARVPAMYWIDKYGLDNLVVAGAPLLAPDYCYAVPHNQKVLLAKLAEGMKILHDSGEYQRIYAKWMGIYEDAPPTLATILRHIAIVVIPLLLFILLIWSRTLRKLVDLRTAELQESQARFKGMFDNMSSGVAVYEPVNDGEDFVFVDFNPAGEGIDKIAKEDVIGKRLTKVFPNVEAFGLLDILRRVWRTGKSEHRPGVKYHDDRIQGWREGFVYKLPSEELVVIYDDTTERQQAEEERERSRAFLQTVVNGVPDNLMVINRDYTIALTNRTVREMVGENPDSACLKCYQVSHGFIVPCDGKEHRCPLQEVIETKAPVTVEHIHSDAQGQKIHVELNAAPIFDAQGEVSQIIELSHDITERKRRENAIASQLHLSEFAVDHSVEELLQAFLDEAEKLTESEMAFFHFVEEDQVTLRLQTWSTHTQEKLCSAKTAGEHYPIDKAGVWVDCVKDGRAVIHNDYASLSHRKGLPEGHVPVVRELVVPVLRKNQMVAILGVGNKKTDYIEEDLKTVQNLANMAWDVVSRKRAEEALSESNNRYHQMFEDNLSVKLIIDPADGRIVEANEAAQAYYGYDSQTLTSTLISKINTLPEEDIKKEMELAKREKRKFFNFRHQLASGEVRDVEVYSGPLQSGNKTYLYSIVHDTTERKRAEEEKQKLEAQLRHSQKMEAVGQLAGGVAHDFNNLLQVILGYGDIALSGDGEVHTTRAPIEEMMKAAERAKTLVTQLLAFSHRQVLDIEDVNLNQVITDLMKIIQRVIGDHITLEIIAGHDLGIIRADPGQIDQILMNLCVNARDAMPAGGTIIIETENVRIDTDFCENNAWAKPGRYALLSVTDTGCGMSVEIIANAFEPFFTTKSVGKGTGLGLSMVYGLVTQHQGMINVYSEIDKGTTFKIYLPLVERSATAVGDTIKGPVTGGSETILVVEDEQVVREMCQLFLKTAGYKVLTTCDGEEAIGVLEERADEIDLALLDVMMPKLGGRAVYEHIRKTRPDVRVLFSSGYSMNAIHTNFILDEGLTLIQKPFLRDDLLRSVRSVMDNK